MSTFLSYTLIQATQPSDAPEPPIARVGLRSFKDLKLDPASWDLVTPIVLVTGAEAIAQRLTIRLRMWKGEWFLDQRVGVPYLQRVFVVNPSIKTLRRIFTSIIEGTPGVARVENIVVKLDRRARQASIEDFKIRLDDGSTLLAKAGEPFIVGGS